MTRPRLFLPRFSCRSWRRERKPAGRRRHLAGQALVSDLSLEEGLPLMGTIRSWGHPGDCRSRADARHKSLCSGRRTWRRGQLRRHRRPGLSRDRALGSHHEPCRRGPRWRRTARDRRRIRIDLRRADGAWRRRRCYGGTVRCSGRNRLSTSTETAFPGRRLVAGHRRHRRRRSPGSVLGRRRRAGRTSWPGPRGNNNPGGLSSSVTRSSRARSFMTSTATGGSTSSLEWMRTSRDRRTTRRMEAAFTLPLRR